jgi:hypothetical protein
MEDDMSDPVSYNSLMQAIGVVAVYATLKEIIPRLFGRNGALSVKQHDKECDFKLTPIRDKLDEVHIDVKTLMKANGLDVD